MCFIFLVVWLFAFFIIFFEGEGGGDGGEGVFKSNFFFPYTASAGGGLPASCTPGLRIKVELIFRAGDGAFLPKPGKKKNKNR